MSRSCLLFSGGVDSFCAYRFLQSRYSEEDEEMDLLYFDLRTPYTKKEIEFVKKETDGKIIICDDLRFLGGLQEGPKAFVPYRNIFLSMYCAALGYKRIWIAGVKDDQVVDKSDVAFRDFSAFFTRYGDGEVIVDSPFWELTKAQVVEMMLEEDLVTPEELLATVACYSSRPVNYCGNCNCCFRKFIALRVNGIALEFDNWPMIQSYYDACKAGKYDEDRAESTMLVLEAHAREHGRQLTGM